MGTWNDRLYHKIFNSTVIMMVIVTASLGIGMMGYHFLLGLSWIDSFLNAAMILTGMGPLDKANTNAGKLFSGIYAMYSGIVFLSAIAIFIYPIIQKIGKKFEHQHKQE